MLTQCHSRQRPTACLHSSTWHGSCGKGGGGGGKRAGGIVEEGGKGMVEEEDRGIIEKEDRGNPGGRGQKGW